MIFWISTLVMLALAVMCVLWPLARRSKSQPEADDGADTPQLAFFKTQLADVETRLGSEDVTASEREVLESERTEIARRLLRAAKSEQSAQSGSSLETSASAGTRPDAPSGEGWLMGRRLAAVVALCFVPLISLVTYSAIGSPGLRDEPLSARIAPNLENRSIEEMVAMAETHLASNPDDLDGWTVLVGTYKRLGRAQDVARATEQVLRLDGRKPVHLADLAEALTVANGNIVPERASLLLNEALTAEPEMPKALFYAALGLEQEDKKADALNMWKRAMALRREDERWQAAVRSRIVALDPTALPPVARAPTIPERGAVPTARGPQREDVEAASQMSDAERAEMIQGMVASLASRLAEDPNDLPGWEQLVRSYTVLQNSDEARRALLNARKQFSSNPSALAALGRLEESLGLKETEQQ